MKQEDQKEERREGIRTKTKERRGVTCNAHPSEKKSAVSEGECMDSSRATWNRPRCGTTNEELCKFCMECADRNPTRHIEEVASASNDPLRTRGRWKNKRRRSLIRGKLKKEVHSKRTEE